MSNKSGIGPLCSSFGGVKTSCLDKAELFNEYFSSACTVDDGVLPSTSNINPGKANIHSIKFNANDVQRAIKKMKSSSSCGPDDLPALLFKNISACIA